MSTIPTKLSHNYGVIVNESYKSNMTLTDRDEFEIGLGLLELNSLNSNYSGLNLATNTIG
ncbi:MAG: hypothetical protein ACI9RM_001839 [Ulvibacter sp.]|jgi:hypothetical protein